MDLTVVFSSDRMNAAKREAIDIAQRNGAEVSNDMYKVKFNKRCKDLTELVDLCSSWKRSHVLIGTEKYSFDEACEVLYCENRRKCDGRCEHGFSDYVYLLDEIEKCAVDPEDEDIDSDWLLETVSEHKAFEKQPDGSFKIKKDALKQAIEKTFVIPINVCEKFDLKNFVKQIDALPDIFSIPSGDGSSRSESCLDDDEREKIIETANLVAPIFAKAVAKELEYVVIAHFGGEKTASDLAKRADAFNSLERYPESLEYYNKALELDATNSQIWYNKGLLLEIGLEDYEKAIEAYSRAYELDPNNIFSLRDIGICLEYLGREAEAIAKFEKAIGLYEKRLKDNPGDEKAKEELELVKEQLSGSTSEVVGRNLKEK